MEHMVEWLIEKRLCRVVLKKTLSSQESELINDQLWEMLSITTENYPVHIMVDASVVKIIPNNIDIIYSQSTRRVYTSKQLGWLLVITKNVVVRSFTNIIAGFGNKSYRVFTIQEEALTFITEKDPSLNFNQTS
jgi:hypothetical protein